MKDKLDLISIFELLNTHKKTRNGGLYFFRNFTGIIFNCLELEGIRNFEKDWSSEIKHGGRMERSTAKNVYTRERNLYEKYVFEIDKIESDQICSEINDLILKYVDEKKFHKELKEKIEKDRSIPDNSKKELLNEKELDMFLSLVLIYEVKNGWKVKKDKEDKKDISENSYSNTVEVEQSSLNQSEIESNTEIIEEVPTTLIQTIVLPEENKKNEKIDPYSKFINTTFTIEKPADYNTFNAITNNPNYGDERKFVLTKRVSDPTNKWRYAEDDVQDGEEYYIRMYVHNNASAELGLIAEDVKAYLVSPRRYSNETVVQGKLSSSNAYPDKIWDQVYFRSKEHKFMMKYVEGSATLSNNHSRFNLSDDILTDKGTFLGYTQLDGKIPGCYQYSGVVLAKFRVVTQK